MVKNLPYNAGDTGLIPGWGTKMPHTSGQLLSPSATTKEKPALQQTALSLHLSPDAAK